MTAQMCKKANKNNKLAFQCSIDPPPSAQQSGSVCLLGLHYAWGLTTLHQLSPSWPLNPIWTLWDVTVLHQGGCKMSALTRKSSLPIAPPHFTPYLSPCSTAPPPPLPSSRAELPSVGSGVGPPLWSPSEEKQLFSLYETWCYSFRFQLPTPQSPNFGLNCFKIYKIFETISANRKIQ